MKIANLCGHSLKNCANFCVNPSGRVNGSQITEGGLLLLLDIASFGEGGTGIKALDVALDGVVHNAGSVFKVGDNIIGKVIEGVRSGTNGKVAVIGRKMSGHVDDVVAELASQGKQVEAFSDSFQAGKTFDIDGQIYSWQEIISDFDNLKQQYGTIPDNVLENSLMFKANQKWVNKLIDEGYEVIDIGYPEGLTTESVFYNMEVQTIFP